MEPVPHLDRVASRLNRLALQRAIYRSTGTVLLAAALAGVAAYSLSTWSFGLVVAGLAVVCLVVVVGSFLVLRARWKRRLDAAHWVEDKVDLDQRLLTLVSASSEHDKARLWPELEMDNRAHLVAWGDEKLRIRRIPGNLALLLVGLVAAAISLVPSRDAEVRGMEQAGTSRETGLGEAPRSGAIPAPGSGLAQGELEGEGDVGSGKGSTDTSQALVRLKSELERRYASSLIAQALAPGEQKIDQPGEAPSRFRADLPESDRNESQAQPGGALPPEGLAHLVQDDGKGKTAARKESGEGQGAAAGPGGGGKEGQAPSGMREGTGAPAPGSKGKKPGPGDEKVLLSEDATQRSQGTGGGAGNAKATGPLLAPKPLELKGGRQAARFALTLGAPPGSQSGSGKDSVPEEPRSYIASGERGEQAEDRSVRHESIPQEYESVIKRIFERNS